MPAPPLILFDGLCGFCDASVQWLLAHDPERQFEFAPLQGEAAGGLIARHPLPDGLDSIVLVTGRGTPDEALTWHSAAIFGICARLPMPWRALAWFGLLPRPLTDLGYRTFARYRYLVWGRKDACRIPTPLERARFLA